jgi:putative flavoprotein involved in K+ transport
VRAETEHFETIVIGGSQTGLTVGYYLAQQGREFLILEANENVGDAWRNRWDSLRLFTPAKFSRLPGMKIPGASAWDFVTKDELADYLERYARRFQLPIRTGVPVDGLSKSDGWFVVSAGNRRFEAENVIVATGAHRIPKVPEFASQLDATIVQLPSSEYRSPGQLADGDVLIVGAGNSGAEIAYELAETRHCLLAGKSPGQIPVPHGSLRFRPGFRTFRFFAHRLVRVDTAIGRKLAPTLLATGDPLIRRRERDLSAVGVERVGRVVGVERGLPVLEDGRVVDVPNVIWCTGFRTDFSWIDLPVFDGDGQPEHYRGVVESEPGLYFLGLVFQYSFSSDALPDRGRDARYIAKHISARRREPGAVEPTKVKAAA